MVDLVPIRERVGRVKKAMSQDCGPTTAEPYSTWAAELANDVLTLLTLVDTELEQKGITNGQSS